MADRVGQQLGNYRLVSLIGHGGFADVYLGEHIYLDTPAAIKVLHTELSSEDTEHFRKEARTIARLIHPHIVRVLEFGVEGCTPFLVVDYAPNGTLRKHHPRGIPVPLSSIVAYVSQLADALQYAHSQRVIHRDVKPENMLLGRRNEVLLSDFGIALVAQTSRYQNTRGLQEAAGTISYMAPEQIQSQAVANSDQYALGVVVYEWLSGARPFQGSFTEIAVKHTLVPPPSLRKYIPDLPLAIEEVVMKALAKEPDQRFPTVRDFALALQAACQGQPDTYTVVAELSTEQPGPAGPGETFPLQSQVGTPAALLEDLEQPGPSSQPGQPGQPGQSIPTPKIITPSDEHITTPPSLAGLPNMPPPNPQKASTATPASSQDPLETPATVASSASATASSIATEPSSQPGARDAQHTVRGSHISRRAAIASLIGAASIGVVAGGVAWYSKLKGEGSGASSSTTSSTSGNVLYTYHGHTNWVWSAAWSHDGSRIASASSDKTVQVWDAKNGMLLYSYSGHPDSVYAVSWSPDDKRIASAGNDQTVQTWDAQGGHPFTYNGHSSWVWAVAWSPDGKRIASAGGDKTVQIWNAVTGVRLYTYGGHNDDVHAVAWAPNGQYIASAGSDRTVQVWDPIDGTLVYTFRPYDTSIWSITWSPNSSRIASAGDNKTVQVWDATSGDHPYVYYGHTDFVYGVAWSPDSKRIASGGDDRTVRVWDASNGGETYIYSGHTASVRSVAWSPDSKRIASTGYDKTVQIWHP